jgi:hypothetical protein
MNRDRSKSIPKNSQHHGYNSNSNLKGSKTSNSKKPNNSRKISQSKTTSTNNGKQRNSSQNHNQGETKNSGNRKTRGGDLMSPKTIEYSKVMEKYGELLSESSPKYDKNKKIDYNNYTYRPVVEEENRKSRKDNESDIKQRTKYTTITDFESMLIFKNNKRNK